MQEHYEVAYPADDGYGYIVVTNETGSLRGRARTWSRESDATEFAQQNSTLLRPMRVSKVWRHSEVVKEFHPVLAGENT